MTDMVYVAPAGRTPRTHYHHDDDCYRLGHAKDAVEKDLDVLQDGIKPCPHCVLDEDETAGRAEPDMSYLRSLKEAAEKNQA